MKPRVARDKEDMRMETERNRASRTEATRRGKWVELNKTRPAEERERGSDVGGSVSSRPRTKSETPMAPEDSCQDCP